jgi:hypothetical protein
LPQPHAGHSAMRDLGPDEVPPNALRYAGVGRRRRRGRNAHVCLRGQTTKVSITIFTNSTEVSPFHTSCGCPAADRLQKLPLRPRAEPRSGCYHAESSSRGPRDSQGGGEAGRSASPDFGVRAAARELKNPAPARSRGNVFLIWSSKSKNAFSPSRTSPSPRLPVNLDRTSRPKAATEVSAIGPRLGSPK